MGHDAYDDAVRNRSYNPDPRQAMKDQHNREEQAQFAAHNFQRRCQGCAEVTLPGDTACLISEYIDALEHEVHRLRNGHGRYGT